MATAGQFTLNADGARIILADGKTALKSAAENLDFDFGSTTFPAWLLKETVGLSVLPAETDTGSDLTYFMPATAGLAYTAMHLVPDKCCHCGFNYAELTVSTNDVGLSGNENVGRVQLRLIVICPSATFELRLYHSSFSETLQGSGYNDGSGYTEDVPGNFDISSEVWKIRKSGADMIVSRDGTDLGTAGTYETPTEIYVDVSNGPARKRINDWEAVLENLEIDYT